MNNLFDLKELTKQNGFEKYVSDFQTPPAVCSYMVSLIPDWVKSVLEPTPGIGNLVNALNGYDVTAPEDFFLLKPRKFDAIIMNPPFSSKYANMQICKMHRQKSINQVCVLVIISLPNA